MSFEWRPFTELLAAIVDNRGRTCPVGDAGLPLIATNCIDDSSLYPRYETSRFVADETYRTWFRGHPMPGDILFVCKGSPGRTNWCPDPVDFCIAQDMVAVRADLAKISPKYLFAALRSSLVQAQISNLHVGTMIPHFKKGDFGKLRIPVPDAGAQAEIGDFYFDVSMRIALLRETNATLEAIAQALFKSWFVDFDPVRAKSQGLAPAGMDEATAALFPEGFEDSEKGPIPRGWRWVSLRDVVSIYDSKRIPLSGQERAKRRGPFPYYGAAALMDHVDDHLFEGTHVLVGEDGSVTQPDGMPVLQYVWGKFWVNNHAHVLQGAHGICTEHVLLSLRSTNIQHLVTGAVQAKLSQGNMWRIDFMLPSREVAGAFASIIGPLFARFRQNAEQAQSLAEVRDALLPRLISGQLRLPEAIAETEEAL
ncbi:restriction endonuclease subunit S [Ideonella sp. 4Y11]|uniref:Restriction endonuclease subunit S n=1 Tax=Ideonella aquatica TaxID=2824119 RepID=A0A941BHJ3_9BURK|nr:restriction endonuclease subunit S [Ideonella aquatica]MBQ0957702.1 restriction endonuclease subunit S [Ideonella aquatica]